VLEVSDKVSRAWPSEDVSGPVAGREEYKFTATHSPI